MTNAADGDEWETDPDFVNDISEKESRWGAKTVAGSGHQGSCSMEQLRKEVLDNQAEMKKKQLDEMPKPSAGYGGKFGVQTDRIDKSAETWEYKGVVDKHASQMDYAKGFGGKFGVETDRKDNSAVGWEYHESLAQHTSQKDCTKGFGGKYGVEKDKQDKSAVGWEYKAALESHESQKDYSKGFGGKFGVQEERKDKSAVGWDYHEKVEPHMSQKDYAKGFGGKYGVESDRQDKSAESWDYKGKLESHESQKDYSRGFGGKFGVETDRKDKSAVDWSYKENVPLHESQTDYSKGFGGKYGVQTERQDKSAEGWNSHANGRSDSGAKPTTGPPVVEKGHASSLKARFEKLTCEEAQKADGDVLRLAQERRRQEDLQQQEEQRRLEEERQAKVAVFNAERERKYSAAELQEENHVQHETHFVPKVSPAHKMPAGAVPVLAGSVVTPKHTEPVALSEMKVESSVVPATRASAETEPTIPPASNRSLPEEVESCAPAVAVVPSPEHSAPVSSSALTEHPLAEPAHPMADTGVRAVALYDYQAADDDELSFEPDDIITSIEQIDAGWWRGMCNAKYGLFPANYVELLR